MQNLAELLTFDIHTEETVHLQRDASLSQRFPAGFRNIWVRELN